MLILLISRILIYVFLLVSINVTFYSLFGNINLNKGRFFLLGLLQSLGFSSHSLNPYCSFAIARVCMLLYTWKISWSLLTSIMLARRLKLSFALLLHLGLHIQFFKSDFHSTQESSFWGDCWNTVDMSISLPSNKLNGIQ